ncbi:MAG: radical SAM protein [Promethearchaeota archaeon]
MECINKIQIFRKKTALLLKGVNLTEKTFDSRKLVDFDIDFGRKGGAGPLGGRYFILSDDSTLVNVPLKDGIHYSSDLELRHLEGPYFNVYDKNYNESFNTLKLVENPRFYDLKTSDNVPMEKIALVHGIDCLASTIYQKCRYWACGEACKFCGIELSLKQETTILEKNSQQLSEVISAAKRENRCKHITLTTGTVNDEDKGSKKYIKLLNGIRNNHPDIPIHIQIEPMKDLKYIQLLKEAGADTIGIHIELIKESLRKIFTPGKSKIPYMTFEDNWKEAIEVFGKNQVETYLLYGFRKNNDEFIEDMEAIIALGVIPYITPVRAIPGKKSLLTVPNQEDLIFIYQKAAKMMKEFNVNPLEHKAGCVRCGGCSAINEAYMAV